MLSPLLYLCLSLQQMQLLTKSQNENRDDHVELANVDFTLRDSAYALYWREAE